MVLPVTKGYISRCRWKKSEEAASSQEWGQLTSLDKDLHDDRCVRYVADV